MKIYKTINDLISNEQLQKEIVSKAYKNGEYRCKTVGIRNLEVKPFGKSFQVSYSDEHGDPSFIIDSLDEPIKRIVNNNFDYSLYIKNVKKTKIKRGDVVIFDPSNFNPDYWNELSEDDKIKYYGPLGYGSQKPKLFVFITRIKDVNGDSGHCILISLDDQKIETMRHTNDFRKARDSEF